MKIQIFFCFLVFFSGRIGGTRVSDFFFTMNSKLRYFFFLGGGEGG